MSFSTSANRGLDVLVKDNYMLKKSPPRNMLFDSFDFLIFFPLSLPSTFFCHTNPREAIRCFYDSGIDALILGNYMLTK